MKKIFSISASQLVQKMLELIVQQLPIKSILSHYSSFTDFNINKITQKSSLIIIDDSILTLLSDSDIFSVEEFHKRFKNIPTIFLKNRNFICPSTLVDFFSQHKHYQKPFLSEELSECILNQFK